MAMLQFSGMMCNSAARFGQARFNQFSRCQQFSTSLVLSSKPALEKKEDVVTKENAAEQPSLVKTAFENLKNMDEKESNEIHNLKLGDESKNVHKKLSIGLVNRLLNDVRNSPADHKLLKTFKILMTSVKNGDIELTHFINDSRFSKLLDTLSLLKIKDMSSVSESSDIFLNSLGGAVIQDSKNENLDQLVSVLVMLSKKGFRNVSELNNISEKIVNSKEKWNIKQATDILYCVTVLNFPQEVLMKYICKNLLQTVPGNTKTAIVGSILTSLGMLSYKNEELLDTLSEWSVTNWSKMRPQDKTALALTLATVGYIPKNEQILFEDCFLKLDKNDMVVMEDWLDIVWSFVVLNKATHDHISSVLDPSFLQMLMEPEIMVQKAHKLLNINAIAMLQLKDEYKGPLLETNSQIFSVSKTWTKDKSRLVKAVLDPLKSLFPFSTVINTNVDTGMGFLLDVECIIDENCRRTLISDSKKQLKEPIRLAIVTQGYHEFTRGSQDLLGAISLQTKLLQLANYKLLSVPYTEFNVQSTLITRLKYLSQRITPLVETCSK